MGHAKAASNASALEVDLQRMPDSNAELLREIAEQDEKRGTDPERLPSTLLKALLLGL